MRFLASHFQHVLGVGVRGGFQSFFHPEGAQRKKSMLHRFFLKKRCFCVICKSTLDPAPFVLK